MKILILEDDLDVREVTEALISSSTRIVFSVGSIDEAFNVINSESSIDLIISDFNLGDKTYFDFLDILIKKNILIPIFLYSGFRNLNEISTTKYLIGKFSKPNIDYLKRAVVNFEKSLHKES